MKQYSRFLLTFAALLAFSASAWSWPGSPGIHSSLAPVRTVSLPADWNARQWADQHQLPAYRQQAVAGGRQQLSFRADDEQWQQLNQRCGDSAEGALCAVDSCQGIRAAATDPGQLWLNPKAPDLSAALAGQPQSCPADLQSQRWDGRFPADSDPACWNLQQAIPCQTEDTPGEYLQPHWRSNMILLTMAAGAEGSADLAARTGLQLMDETVLKSTGDRLMQLLRVDTATPLDDWVLKLQAEPGVLQVQKDFAYFTLANSGDPLGVFNYGPAMTGSDRLLARYRGERVRVAVIDTGIDLTHPELADVVVEQRDFSGRGYSGDAHGTAVAAIIAAARNNGIGASGVAPAVKISSFKACHPRQPDGLAAQCWSSSLIKALDQAISAEIPLINMSLGGPPSPLLQRLLEAAERRGQLVLAAAGNGGPSANPVYPAALPQSLAVTAVDSDRRLYVKANRGDYIGVAAPGVDIITAGPRGGQPILSGTSMATAHATGIAALLLQANPRLTAVELTRVLTSSSEDLGNRGADPAFGQGLLNACRGAGQIVDVSGLCGGAL